MIYLFVYLSIYLSINISSCTYLSCNSRNPEPGAQRPALGARSLYRPGESQTRNPKPNAINSKPDQPPPTLWRGSKERFTSPRADRPTTDHQPRPLPLVWMRSPTRTLAPDPNPRPNSRALQGYLAHKKIPLPRTLQQPHDYGPTVILEGWGSFL